MTAFEVEWGNVAEAGMAPPRVVPAFDVGKQRAPRFGVALEAAPVDQLALETGKETLRHRVVVGITDTAHRRAHAHLGAALAEGNAGVLAALVTVMNDALRFALGDGHVQRREYEIRRHLLADRPAHHTPAPYIEHDGEEDEAGPGGHVGHVGHPQLIRARGGERALDQIRRRPLFGITPGRHHETAASTDATEARSAHQAGDPLASNARTFITQLGMNVGTAVVAIGHGMNGANTLSQHRVRHCPRRGRTLLPGVVAARRHFQHSAQRPHREVGLVRAHEFEEDVDAPRSCRRTRP